MTQSVIEGLFDKVCSEFMFFVQRELQDIEKEENRRVRGFREVVDLISSSQKPVVSQNYLSGNLPSLDYI